MSRSEGWAKLTNSLWLNEKIGDLVESKPRLVCLWMMSLSYASDQLTDGVIDRRAARRLGVSPRTARQLVEAGLWDAEGDASWRVHDYLDYQTPAHRVDEKRAAAAQRQRRKRKSESRETSRVTEGVTAGVTDDVTQRVTFNQEPQNQEPNNQEEKEREEKDPSPSDDDWRSRLKAWEPKPQHHQLANTQAGRGYTLVDVHDLALEFRLSVEAKQNRYGYRDFDAAFSSWILKRSKEKPRDARKPRHLVPTDAQIESLVGRVQTHCMTEGMEPPDYLQLKAVAVKALAGNELDEDSSFMEILDRMSVETA